MILCRQDFLCYCIYSHSLILQPIQQCKRLLHHFNFSKLYCWALDYYLSSESYSSSSSSSFPLLGRTWFELLLDTVVYSLPYLLWCSTSLCLTPGILWPTYWPSTFYLLLLSMVFSAFLRFTWPNHLNLVFLFLNLCSSYKVKKTALFKL